MTEFKELKYQDNLGFGNKVIRLVWNVIWLLLIRTNPRVGFNGWRLLLLKIFGAKIGEGCKVSPSCRIWAPWNLEMGDFSVLGDEVDCYSMNAVILGSKVAVSQGAYLCTGSHDVSDLRRPLITKPIKINDHAWVCARAIIYPGVEVGEGAVVAAGAVVVKNIPSWYIVGGNPAINIKQRKLQD